MTVPQSGQQDGTRASSAGTDPGDGSLVGSAADTDTRATTRPADSTAGSRAAVARDPVVAGEAGAAGPTVATGDPSGAVRSDAAGAALSAGAGAAPADASGARLAAAADAAVAPAVRDGVAGDEPAAASTAAAAPVTAAAPAAAADDRAGTADEPAAASATAADGTAVAGPTEAPTAAGESISLDIRVPADPAQLPLLRSVAGALAGAQDFDIDTIADLRIAVDELAATVIRRARPGALMGCLLTAGPDGITVSASAPAQDTTPIDQTSFGWMVLTTLAGDVAADVSEVDGSGPTARMRFRVSSGRVAR